MKAEFELSYLLLTVANSIFYADSWNGLFLEPLKFNAKSE